MRDSADPPSPTPAMEGHDPSQLSLHLRLGHDLIPLHRWDHDRERERGKSPRDVGWRGMEYRDLDARAHAASGCNVGVRLGPTDLVIDADPRNYAEGRDSLAELCRDMGLDPDDCPTVLTGSGGKHLYLKKPPHVDVVASVAEYPGVELKTHGTQAVAAGSVHPRTGRTYRWDPLSADRPPVAPSVLLDRFSRPLHDDADGGGCYSPEQVREMLSRLDVTLFASESEWFPVMAAAHHASGGRARQEFLDWCAGDPRYQSALAKSAARWDSLRAGPGGRKITAGTLHRILREHGAADAIPTATAQEDFADAGPAKAPGACGSERLSSVADQWVYVADPHAFVRRSDCKKYGPEQWRALHASTWDGDVVSAAFKGKLPVRKCESLVYVPCRPEFIGEATYNVWRQSGVDAKPGDVGPFLAHAEYLLPDAAERDMLLDYLALLVQRPADKIMFACLLRGVQGTGKSWVGEVMARIIGDRNVSRPSNDDVVGNYTGWMEGAQLALIEELMTLGRLEVANRLKPLITQPTLRINEKYLKAYTIPNHLNLLCFTNHRDALRIENGDRRWLVLLSPAKPRGEPYYDGLFRFLEGGGACAVKDWLLSRAVSLNPKGRAPDTRGKEEMRLASMEDLEAQLLALLEAREFPFEFDLARFEDVVGTVRWSSQSKSIRAKVTKFLKDEAGAVCQGRYTKGDRPSHTLWSIRDHERWDEAGAANRIDAFMEYLKSRRA